LKFWNKIENDIFIYGDIQAQEIFESDVTAKKFADDLKSCSGAVTVHINSNGGDCFTALAISNLIKAHKNFVTVAIEGICASAATLIACGGHKVIMAENALMMIHLPSVGLCDFMTAPELEKVADSLDKVKNSIIEVYKSRTGLEIAELEKMVEAETWLTAQEAKDLNFIDEISGAVEEKIDDAKKLVIINSVTLKADYFLKAIEKKSEGRSQKSEVRNQRAAVRGQLSAVSSQRSESDNCLLPADYSISTERRNLKMKTETLLDKIKNLLTGDKVEKVSQSVVEERQRIESLQKLKTDNAAVNAIIDVAVSEGAKASEVQKYIDAVANVEISDNVGEKILALIQDNLTSGAESVGGSFEVDKSKSKAEMIADFANKMR